MTTGSPHYTVLARRFRPQKFDDVVGQQHVAQALRNAIRGGRVAHAYLFTGARGVGKTSMARILAKALNCPSATDGDPCNDCEICQGIAAGNDVDVLEIDGASNRGIDDIRSLRANVNIRSMRTQYKLYIIDEVHMLTKEAFNALLKTLEEPPESVKFVFCTTEPNKVPDTILSRCQRFDFGSIEMTGIIDRLGQIAEAEGVAVAPEALALVARRAAGSMRDSQSLFDQLLAFGEDRIEAEGVHRLLGTADDERLIEIVDALVESRRADALTSFDQALADGVQLGELVDQLVNYFRDLMLSAAGAGEVALLSVSREYRDRLQQQAQTLGLQTTLAALQILADTKGRMFRASYARTLAEMALVRICLLEQLESLDTLIEGLKSTAAAAPAGARTPSAPQKKSDQIAEGRENSAPDPGVSPPEEPPATAQPGDLKSQLVAMTKDMLKTHVQAASRIATSGPNHLDFWFPSTYAFSKRACEKPSVLAQIEELAKQVTGQNMVIRLRLEEEPAAEQGEEQPAPPSSDPKPTDPFVEKALSLFGGNVVKVEAGHSPSDSKE